VFRKPILLAAVLALASPGIAAARDDADVFPHDPAARTTTFLADGSIVLGTTGKGERAWVRELVERRAAGGVLEEDTATYRFPTTIRVGVTAPTVALAPMSRSRTSLRYIRSSSTIAVDGTRTVERGFARSLRTGRLLAVSLADARRLSADPRAGRANVMYFYSMERGLPVEVPAA
jgi:hypothetical protein